jgi:Integrase core domain
MATPHRLSIRRSLSHGRGAREAHELSPIPRIDTARVRPVQSASSRSFIEPGSPWRNPFVELFGSRVRDDVLSVEAFNSGLEAQTVITDWRTIYIHRRPCR